MNNFPEKYKEANKFGKVPFWCTKCEEIRGVDSNHRMVMQSTNEELMWNSFGMCSVCYVFQRDFPAEAEKNKAAYGLKQTEKQKQADEEFSLHKYRVLFEEADTSFHKSTFAKSITGIDFQRYPTIYNGKPDVVKSRKLFKEAEAIKAVELLTEKGLKAWYEDELLSTQTFKLMKEMSYENTK